MLLEKMMPNGITQEISLPFEIVHEIVCLPIVPLMARPKFLSIAFRHGTNVNSLEFSITAYFPLGLSIVFLNFPDSDPFVGAST